MFSFQEGISWYEGDEESTSPMELDSNPSSAVEVQTMPEDEDPLNLSSVQNVIDEEFVVDKKGGKRKYPHRVHGFLADLTARTTDPNVMDHNYRIPIRYFRFSGRLGQTYLPRTANDKEEMIVSRQFVEKDPRLLALFDMIEHLRGFCKERPEDDPPRAVIKRSTVYSGKSKITMKPRFNILERMNRKEKALTSISKPSKSIKKADKKIVQTSSKIMTRARAKTQAQSSSNHPKIKLTTAVASAGLAVVDLGSLDCLRPEHYVNDSILEYGLHKTLESCGANLNDGIVLGRVYQWGSFWSRDNKNERQIETFYAWLKKNAPSNNPLKIQHLVIPICTENHWLLAIICSPFPSYEDVEKIKEMSLKEGRSLKAYNKLLYHQWVFGRTDARKKPIILFFDSLGVKLRKRGRVEIYFEMGVVTRLIEGLQLLHQKLWMGELDCPLVYGQEYPQIPFHHVIVPGQMDTINCGIFCMNYLKMWVMEVAKRDGDYMSFCMTDLKDMFQPYASCISRENLLEDIYEDAKSKGPEFAKAVIATVKSFWSPK